MTQEKKILSTFQKVLASNASKKTIRNGIDEIINENNGDLSVNLERGYRIIDLVVLGLMDYNVDGYSKSEVSKFLKKYQEQFTNIINNDTTENNPIALIVRNRTSGVLLEELLNNLDLSQANIDKNPGLKMLTTTFKMIIKSGYHNPSDHLNIVLDRFKKEEHLKKTVGELNLAYVCSNLFEQKNIKDVNFEELTELTKNDIKIFNSRLLDKNINVYFQKIIDSSLNYLTIMSKEDKETFKEKLEKELFVNLSLVDFENTTLVLNNNPIKYVLKLLDIDSNTIRLKYYYGPNLTLDEFDLNSEINDFIKKIAEVQNNLYKNKTTETLVSENIKNLLDHNFVKMINEKLKNNEIINILDYKRIITHLDKFLENCNNGKLITRKEKNSREEYFENRGLSELTLNMEKIYNYIDEPMVAKLFKNLEKKILLMKNHNNYSWNVHNPKLDEINEKVIKPLTAIVQLKDIFPNREDVINKINENLDDLLEGKKEISQNGILKDVNMIESKEKKSILEPLIKELNTIKENYQQVFKENNFNNKIKL